MARRVSQSEKVEMQWWSHPPGPLRPWEGCAFPLHETELGVGREWKRVMKCVLF